MKGKNSMFSFCREDAVKTGRFLAFFIIIYIVLSFSVKAVFPVETIELWVANNVLAFLQLLGHQGSIAMCNTVGCESVLIQLDAAGPVIEISEFCTGLMETLIIVGAIIASIGIDWRKRLFGAVSAGLAVIVLNYARIVFTALLILGANDLAVIDFTHNILFRAFLFVSVAGIYIAWFWWAAGGASAIASKRAYGTQTSRLRRLARKCGRRKFK